MKNTEQLCLYDVCNDYSLDVCADPAAVNWNDYRKVRKEQGTYFFHKKYDELHYFEGAVGLAGMYL